MKKLLLFSVVSLMALSMAMTSACTKEDEGEVSGDYVDIGLSSGTKWKDVNEKNDAVGDGSFFSYAEAVASFDDKLPSREQWIELVNECTWTWSGMGYKVVGPNGKSISLSAAGYREWDGSVDNEVVGSIGSYWSSTPRDSDYAWFLSFDSGNVSVNGEGVRGMNIGYSVRLVKNK